MEILIRNKTEAVYTLSIRNKIAKTKEERLAIIEQASKFVPVLSQEIREQDQKKNLI